MHYAMERHYWLNYYRNTETTDHEQKRVRVTIQFPRNDETVVSLAVMYMSTVSAHIQTSAFMFFIISSALFMPEFLIAWSKDFCKLNFPFFIPSYWTQFWYFYIIISEKTWISGQKFQDNVCAHLISYFLQRKKWTALIYNLKHRVFK